MHEDLGGGIDCRAFTRLAIRISLVVYFEIDVSQFRVCANVVIDLILSFTLSRLL